MKNPRLVKGAHSQHLANHHCICFHDFTHQALNCMNGKAFYGTRITVTYVPHTNTVSTSTMDDINDRHNSHHRDSNNYRNTSDDNLYNSEFNYNIENMDKNKINYKSGGFGRGDDAGGTKSCAGNDGDGTRSFLHLKNLASSLADNRHPINIKDIDNFSNVNVIRTNRNSR